MKKLPLSFFNSDAVVVAKELLGCYLVTETDGGLERYLITETEAYAGPHDLACHSSKGRTKRTEVMYQHAGTIYVYLIYGMHNMLNIVTGEKDYPAAVLLRAVEHEGIAITGPGRVTKQLHITRMINGMTLGHDANLWIESPNTPTKRKILRTPRIGIDYAGPVPFPPIDLRVLVEPVVGNVSDPFYQFFLCTNISLLSNPDETYSHFVMYGFVTLFCISEKGIEFVLVLTENCIDLTLSFIEFWLFVSEASPSF